MRQLERLYDRLALPDPKQFPSTIVEAFEENLRAFILAAQGCSWAEVGNEDDVSWLLTGLPWSWCNGIVHARFEDATADHRIEAVLEPFRARGIDVAWWVTRTSTPADLIDRLHDHGLVADEPVDPGMVCDLSTWSGLPVRAGLTIERVCDAAAFTDWCDVFVAGMGMPTNGRAAFEQRFVDIAVGAQAPIRAYLARNHGQPIATGFGVAHRDLIGIYAVATVPEARRQGIGAAITARIMEDARRAGARYAILESSEMGLALYRRLGYHTVCEVTRLTGRPTAR
jgi:GNAT superfamily N-acetyltransferase